ncbi:hypothetical protein AGMMS50229_03110 [Campylobacterota bacterium]|nr:hypothetical protein AGMMS50229_03110 [Campylobacterota bacterium]
MLIGYGLLFVQRETEKLQATNFYMLNIYRNYTAMMIADLDDMLIRVGQPIFHAAPSEKVIIEEIAHGRYVDDPLLHEYFVIDTNLAAIITSNPKIPILPRIAQDTIVFPTKASGSVVSTPFRCVEHNEDVIALTHAFYDEDGELLGYGVFLLDLKIINERFRAFSDYDISHIVSLFTANGLLMASNDPIDELIGSMYPAFADIQFPIKESQLNRIMQTLDGSWQLVSFAPTSRYNLIVSSGVHYINIYKQLVGVFIYLLIAFIALMVIAYRISKRTLSFELGTQASNLQARLSLQGQVEQALIERMEAEKREREHEKMLIQQSKMAAMGEMIGAIAHQWRQPLNSIGLYVQDILDAHRFGELDEAYISDVVEKTMQQLQFMSNTINDFRNFYKPDKIIGEFDLSKVVQDALRLVSLQFQNNSIEVNYEVPSEPLWCKGYENELGQAILNLLSNAKDALLGSARENRKITILLSRVGSEARLEIGDNGGGIVEANIDRIFEPYFTTKEQGKGTGIGLYMSKMIVEESMQGQLSARNIPGGACFTINLPIVREGVDEAEASEAE